VRAAGASVGYRTTSEKSAAVAAVSTGIGVELARDDVDRPGAARPEPGPRVLGSGFW
jgi:hypothetical protein